MTQSLDPDTLAHIAQTCASHQLPIRHAERHGTLLVLTPASLHELPSADTLRELADSLGGDGIRYVTLRLDLP
jgi:hypothetical protein